MSEMQIPVWNGPSPKPRDASTAAQRLIDLANLVPAGEWVSYGDLADAYVVHNGENMVARGVASALSLRPADVFIEERAMANPQPRVDQWYVPWHRVRLANGLAAALKYGAVASDDFSNRMFVNEGGQLRHGAATETCRFNIAAEVREIAPATENSQQAPMAAKRELTEEQRVKLVRRAEERRHRMRS